jgi:hypothetical protein
MIKQVLFDPLPSRIVLSLILKLDKKLENENSKLLLKYNIIKLLQHFWSFYINEKLPENIDCKIPIGNPQVSFTSKRMNT